jgi:hypothetical protein
MTFHEIQTVFLLKLIFLFLYLGLLIILLV